MSEQRTLQGLIWRSPFHADFRIVRVLVLTGAGVSAESGIPTFRGKDGYWRNFDPTKLATPQAFASDPRFVWLWYRERRQGIRKTRPNAAHQAVARLARHVDKFLLVTQNVDDLHVRGGMPMEKMVQIHGDIFVTRCSRCDWTAETTAAGEQEDTDDRVPACSNCSALMRPGVVWFGEQLLWGEVERVEHFLGAGPCNAVIVAGTTATFGYIIDWAIRGCRDGGELIEVNPEETPLSQFATRHIREPAASALPRIVDELISPRDLTS